MLKINILRSQSCVCVEILKGEGGVVITQFVGCQKVSKKSQRITAVMRFNLAQFHTRRVFTLLCDVHTVSI